MEEAALIATAAAALYAAVLSTVLAIRDRVDASNEPSTLSRGPSQGEDGEVLAVRLSNSGPRPISVEVAGVMLEPRDMEHDPPRTERAQPEDATRSRPGTPV